MLTVKEQIAGIVKSSISYDSCPELDAYISMQWGGWDGYDHVNEEQAEDAVTALCLGVAETVLREFVVLEKEDDDG